MNNVTDHRDHEVRVLTAVAGVICGTACATSVIPGLEDLMNRVLITVGVLLLLGVLARFGARWVRERLEDRADDRMAPIWAAQYAATHAVLPAPTNPAHTVLPAPRLHVVTDDAREVA